MDDSVYEGLIRVRGPGDDTSVKLLQRHDPAMLEGLKAYYADAILGRTDGAISRATKEMVIMVCAAAQRSWGGMNQHMAKALDHGAKPRQILEFIEAASINSGIPVLWRGTRALADELERRGLPFE
jgi:alkylhydroperoxidase/carboxymuconolactone decarboxylase family protein YurZ